MVVQIEDKGTTTLILKKYFIWNKQQNVWVRFLKIIFLATFNMLLIGKNYLIMMTRHPIIYIMA